MKIKSIPVFSHPFKLVNSASCFLGQALNKLRSFLVILALVAIFVNRVEIETSHIAVKTGDVQSVTLDKSLFGDPAVQL